MRTPINRIRLFTFALIVGCSLPTQTSAVVTKIDLPLSFTGNLEGIAGQEWSQQALIECAAICDRWGITLAATSSAPQVLTVSVAALQQVVVKGVSVGTSDVTVCAGSICSSQTFTVKAAPPPPPPAPPPGVISSVTCGDFARWRAAQDYYLYWRDRQAAARALDADGDGIACENLPGAP